jgi:hypothetical protein
MPTVQSQIEPMLTRPSVELVCVDPERSYEVWPFVCDLIRRSMQRGAFGAFAPIENEVLAGRMLLWLAADETVIHAAAVTVLAQTEWRKVCEIVACGGHGMCNWLPLLAGIEDYARAEGCSAMRILGRKGWMRALPDYQVRRVVLEKEIA